MENDSRLRIWNWLIYAVCGLLLTACVQGRALARFDPPDIDGEPERVAETRGPQPASEVSVELDVFSGQPNPTWILSEAQSSMLGELLLGLRPAERLTPRFDGLGYRGFIVRLVAPQSRAQSTVYVYGGTIEVVSEAGQGFFGDTHRNVETWLLDTAKPAISEDLYRSLSDEIWRTLYSNPES